MAPNTQTVETEIAQPSPENASRTKRNKAKKGLSFSRRFTDGITHPYERINWTKRDAEIKNESGEDVFSQQDVEVPDFWSQMATNVVVSKYFKSAVGRPDRETSIRQLISRVADTISAWGRKDNYFTTDENEKTFNEELTAILVEQYAAFNSPVWFNVGVEEKPQCSACFILAVEDSIDGLLELQRSEGRLFKYGSGCGTNLSSIRSSRETLSGGGVPSGPISFMRGYDSWAGTIKSGGKTRRAAKMQILDCDHGDIQEFVSMKRLEEEKAWALIEQGYPGGFNVPGGAYDSVFFQNANLSVRATDEFMTAASQGGEFMTKTRKGEPLEKVDAKKIMHEIAHGTWVCGDPGMQFDSTINDWHTCPNSGRINASNPCSEYMHVDNSACNLASINLLKFLEEDGSFDTEKYRHAIDILITAQDILVDNASYPTDEIGANAHAFRQLGLGYANLGALLMHKGVAYDSNEGRAIAATLTSILCGQAYTTSAKLAEEVGPFKEFEKNREPMLKVIGMHQQEAEKIPLTFSTESLIDDAKDVWREAMELGKAHGYRNAQATVLAPTGTIAFMMDCDTTGVEPDIALVKYKKLAGGGMLKIVNNSVPAALRNLGYEQSKIDRIVSYIDEHDTIEGAEDLKDEHLPIFDCAFKARNGSRSIHYMGHLKMMGATQPFISGAISKTVNLPESATVEEIFDTYVEAWKMGIKAVAIYRDNSKRSQPLGTALNKKQESDETTAVVAGRRHLPEERQAITHKFNIQGHEGYITVGLYDDGTPGEIFLVMAKEGSTLSGIMDAYATSISLALQYGVPLSALVKKFSHMRFEPSGMTQNSQIPFAKSIADYIFRWLATKFLSDDEQTKLVIQPVEGSRVSSKQPVVDNTTEKKTVKDDKPGNKKSNSENSTVNVKGGINGASIQVNSKDLLAFDISEDAPPCSGCGSSLMVRQGACYRCLNCGSQGGCG